MSVAAGSRDQLPESISRTTREGRRLNYQLTVIQQPERARACGSGAKSSADRRPVDPPPVVELRVFEYTGPGPNDRKDITFGYNANFFLYATLESARSIAQGRMPNAQQPPVLTGMPVSGMAYLDRPQEAGYFIFPDLSVRHEGKYKLSFNLYEETKDPKDQDAEPPKDAQARGPAGNAASGSFDWRLEVKSLPFTVYSAKKFPGLAESTVLSRTVAEQGCRVRIRRDVRMRRRDGKEDATNYDMENDYERSRRTSSPADTPHEFQARPRSASNNSADRQSFIGDRRPSIDQYPQPYAKGYAQPPAVQAPGTAAFAPPSHFPPQHAAYPPPPAPIAPQQPRFAPPPPPPASAATAAAPPPPPSYYQGEYARQAPPSDIYARDPARTQYEAQMRDREAYDRAAYEEHQRRSSVSYPPQPPSSQYSNYPRTQPPAYPSQQPYPPRAPTPASQPHVALAPLKMPPMEPKHGNTSPIGPLSGGPRMATAPPLPSPAAYSERPSFTNAYAPAAAPAPPPAVASDASRNGKRAFDTVFSSSAAAYNQPLHNGRRPTTSEFAQSSTSSFDDDDDVVDMASLKMQYKRADGHIYSRELPTLR